MSKIKLEAKKRDLSIKAKDLLKTSRLPWVVYWPKSEAISVDMDYQQFRKVFLVVKKWTIFTLSIDWKDIDVIVKDFTLDDLYDTLRHIDFIQIDPKSKIKAEVQITTTWESAAVRLWWVLRQEMRSLKIQCLPADLPKEIKADISKLENFSSIVKVSDLELPESVKVLVNPTIIVASVIVPRAVAAAANA